MQLSSLSSLAAAPQRLQSSSAPAEQPPVSSDTVTLGSTEETPFYRFTSRNFSPDGKAFTIESPIGLQFRLPEGNENFNAYYDADHQQMVFKSDPDVIGHEYGHAILSDPWYSQDFGEGGALPERSWDAWGDVDLNRLFREDFQTAK